MPCYITGSKEGDLRLSLEELREETQTLTRLLCDACETLDEEGPPIEEWTSSLRKWYKNHQKIDEERRKAKRAEKNKKKIKQRALSKLTSEEREALNIKI